MTEEAPMPDDVTPFPGATPRDLLAGVLAWTDRHPDDPRLPEVLVAAIRRTLAAPDPPEARPAAEALVETWDATIVAAGSTRVPWARQKALLVERVLAFGAARAAATREACAVTAEARAAWVGLLETARDHWHEDDARLGPCDLCRAVARVAAARRGEGEG